MRCEVLTDPMMLKRGSRMLDAMIEASPIEIRVRQAYVGDCDLLMVYGPGHPIRRPWQMRHMQTGRRMIAWDLGYWDRDNTMRVTIDHDHPQAWLKPEKSDRWRSAKIDLREDAHPDGPIILVGLGAKQVRVLNALPGQWEARALKRIRKLHPGREVLFKPKRPGDLGPEGIRVLKDVPIEQALLGASLVVCRHSNVAVDACIAGVPVECEDGAAIALYGDNPSPSCQQRLEFLQNLAYWQWKPTEAKEAWNYLLQRLSA